MMLVHARALLSICLVPRRLSLDENVRAKKESFFVILCKLYAVFYDLSTVLWVIFIVLCIFFYDLSSLIGNFYSFSVDIFVLTFFGRFMHLMHVYFMQSGNFFF